MPRPRDRSLLSTSRRLSPESSIRWSRITRARSTAALVVGAAPSPPSGAETPLELPSSPGTLLFTISFSRSFCLSRLLVAHRPETRDGRCAGAPAPLPPPPSCRRAAPADPRARRPRREPRNGPRAPWPWLEPRRLPAAPAGGSALRLPEAPSHVLRCATLQALGAPRGAWRSGRRAQPPALPPR